jgi:two-component system sensor histidine kinase KdpD
VARERGSTYVLIGTPAPRRGLKRLGEPLTDRLVRALPGIDVRIVADRSKRGRS